MYEETLKILGGAAILVTAVAWLIRSLIAHFLTKDVMKYREELKAANAVELEKLRSELAMQALEHEVRVRRLDDKIADHLTAVYQRLFRFYESVHNYVKILEHADEPSKIEKHSAVIKAGEEYWDYLLLNRCYVPPKLFKQIREVGDTLSTSSRELSYYLDDKKKGQEAEEDGWMKAYKDTKEKATPMFSALVAEVQRRLGVGDT